MSSLSVIITTHGACENLPLMLLCLDLQREVTSGIHSRTGKRFDWAMGGLSKLPIEKIVVSDGPVQNTPRFKGKFIEVPKEGQVGHNTRGVGIEAATGEWIVLTNEDNYFVQGWRFLLEQQLKDDVGFVSWNGINNLWSYTDYGGVKLKLGYIDLSFAAVRTDIAKKVGYPWRHYDSDFDYLSECAKESKLRKLRLIHMPQTLSIHN